MLVAKRCPRCKKTLPSTRFSKDPRAKYGLRSYCRACNSETSRISRAKNLDKLYEPFPGSEPPQAFLTSPSYAWLKTNLPPIIFEKLEKRWSDQLEAWSSEVKSLAEELLYTQR